MLMVDFSRSVLYALKKNEITMLFSIFRLASMCAKFIIVDLPVPGFPLIQRKPWWSLYLAASSQSLYPSLLRSH